MENEEINRSDVEEGLQDSSDDDLVPPGSKYPRQCMCGQMYSTRQSYYKHQKSCTKEKRVSLYPRKCERCPLVLENKVQFCRHKKNCNGGRDAEVNTVRNDSMRPKVVYPRECEKCHNLFSTKQDFSRHKKVECTAEGYALKVATHTQCLDPGCTRTFYHRTAMVDHLIKDHLKEFKIRQMSFTTMAEFTAWKDEIEAESWTCFRAPYGAKCNGDGTSKYQYFTCQFDAPERKEDKEKSKNKFKWEKGRIPTEVHCPARMLVSVTEGQINVKFIETHNHPLIFHHTVLHRVQLTTRHFIQSCLITGMSPVKVLELLRGDVGELGNRDPNQRPKKEFFITLQYIKHCKSRIKAQGRLHKEDHISVDMHVRNLMHIGRFEVDGVKNDRYDGFDDGKFSPILVYKPQGKPVVVGHPNFDCIKNSAELFIVGFQTEEQFHVMKEGCKTVLCIDSTYSTTEYGFYLVNMVVQDPYGQGYPVAHFITNFQDEETLALAFESIKFRCPTLVVNLLMTDDDQAEYKAFLLIFPGTRHVLCTWHVRRNWNKNMSSIGDKELRRAVNHCLAVLMYEKHEPTFQTMLMGFIAQYKSRCPIFIAYFETNYKERAPVWALCYRNFPHGNTDTNMYCESLHNLLKTYYMERIQNKRVDDLTQIVLRMERDYYMKLWKNKAEGKTEVSVTVTQKRRHTRGIAIKDEDVTHVEGLVWAVKSQDEKKKDLDEEYFVVKHSEKCPVDHCFVQCVTQICKGLCEHLYTCTCPCPGGMCKHIHKVHSIFLRETSTTNHTDRKGEFWDAEEGGNLHLTNPVEVEVQSKEEKDRKKIEEVESLCQILQERCSKPENLKFLDHIKAQLQQLEVMTRNTNKQAPVVEIGTKFQPTMSVNGPQKLVTQSDLKFKRTALKPKATDAVNKNPTYQEKKNIKASLLSLAGRATLKRQRNELALSCSQNDVENSDPSTSMLPNVPAKQAKLSTVKQEVIVPKLGTVVDSKPNITSVFRDQSQLQSNKELSFTPKLGFADTIHDHVLFFGKKSSVTFVALKTLDPHISDAESSSLTTLGYRFTKGWLHEDVIDAYLFHLCSGNDRVHALRCCFANILNTMPDSREPRKLLSDQISESVETLLIPMNLTNLHWILVVAKPKLGEIHVYDPADKNCRKIYLDFFPKLTKLVDGEYKTSRAWGVRCPTHVQQEDSISCGAFVCFYAKEIVHETKSQTVDIDQFRKSIYLVIAGNCLKNLNYSNKKCVSCRKKVPKQHVTCQNCHQPYHISCLSAKHPNSNIQVGSEYRCT